MKNLKTFESFFNKNAINEAINYALKPKYFSEAGIDTASLPALGDSKFCVIRHDMVVINGTEVYLGNATIGSGQGGLKVSVIGIYDTKDEANTAFKNEIKGLVIVSINPKSLLGSKMVKEAYGIDGGDINIGADILIRASLSDEFSNANGKYFDNDIAQFALPHLDATNMDKCKSLVLVIEEILKRDKIF